MYKELLNKFVSTDELRQSLMKPFYQDGYIFASDGFTIMAYPSEDMDEYGVIPTSELNAISFIEYTPNINATILTTQLKDVVELSNKRFNDKYTLKVGECHDCKGSMSVDYEFYSYDGEMHYLEQECPTCDDGTVEDLIENETGDMVDDVKQLIIIEGVGLRTKYLQRLLDVAEALHVEKIQLVHHGEMQKHIFLINEVIILIMPMAKIKKDAMTTLLPV